MNFVRSAMHHFSLNELQAKELFLEVSSDLFSLQVKNESVDNKKVVSRIRELLNNKYQKKIPQQKMYEILSQVLGQKNYNVALFKTVAFKDIFLKELPEILGKIFLGGSTSVYTKDFIPTGISSLDFDIEGGFYLGELSSTVEMGSEDKIGSNYNLVANALKADPNLKVLYISLAEEVKDVSLKFVATLTSKTYKEVALSVKESISNKELDLYKERLMVLRKSSYDLQYLKEDLIAIKNEFSFDLFVVDDPSLFEVNAINEEGESYIPSRSEKMRKTMDCLLNVSKELNCATLTSLKTRNMKNSEGPFLTSHDIADAFDVIAKSNNILSFNRDKNLCLLEKGRRSVFRNKVYDLGKKTN